MKSLKQSLPIIGRLAVVGLLIIAIKAMAEVTTNVEIPVSGTVFNPCNGETVTFSGIEHFTARVTLDGAGGFHIGSHVDIHVTGAGDQGNTYGGNQEGNSQENGRIGEEVTQTLVFTEISKGSAPNFEVHALFHLTVNPDGIVAAFVNNFTAVCRG